MTVFCFLFHMYFIYYFTRLRSAILLFINAVISLTINILPATQNGTCPYAHNYHQQRCWILIERTDCLSHTTWQCRNVVFNSMEEALLRYIIDFIFLFAFMLALIFHSHQTEATYRLDFIWKLKNLFMLGIIFTAVSWILLHKLID